jgi:mono/diheme cytochrome c family protein
MRPLAKSSISWLLVALGIAGLGRVHAVAAHDPIARGEYLAQIMDCGGCHTPGVLAGKPDPTRALAGSEIGFEIPDLGIFYPANLTPDVETGLGSWGEADIIRAVTEGVRPDGRELAPIMPWRSYSHLTPADALALAGYLKSLPSVPNRVPPPAASRDTAAGPFLTVVAPE